LPCLSNCSSTGRRSATADDDQLPRFLTRLSTRVRQASSRVDHGASNASRPCVRSVYQHDRGLAPHVSVGRSTNRPRSLGVHRSPRPKLPVGECPRTNPPRPNAVVSCLHRVTFEGRRESGTPSVQSRVQQKHCWIRINTMFRPWVAMAPAYHSALRCRLQCSAWAHSNPVA